VFLFMGMAFAYYIVIPYSLDFLLGIGGDTFVNATGTKEYIDFVTRLIFWVGIAFELPMVLALASRLGLVQPKQLLGFWRYAIIIICILSAVITPTPDALTLTLVAVPLMGLYALGILMAWI